MGNWFKKLVIGEDYLTRWHIIPRNKWFNIYLHKFVGSDDDRALHDHPWWSVSFKLWGDQLIELAEDERGFDEDGNLFYIDLYRYIHPLWPYFRSATQMHRMILEGDSAWTLFITGPRVRDWGFRVTPKDGGDERGWMHHQEFLTIHGD